MGMGWASGGPLGGATSWPGAPGGTSPERRGVDGGGNAGGTAAPVEAVVASATPTAPACRTAR